MFQLFGSLQHYLFEQEKANHREYGSKQLLVTGTVTSKRHTNSLYWCSCGNRHLERWEVDCLCCQEVAAIDEQNMQGKEIFTYHVSLS